VDDHNSMKQDNKALVQHILNLSNDIFGVIKFSLPPEWLTSDMTVAQLRVMLILHTDGASRMSFIASSIGTTLSTITGTVDILVKKGLVVRRDDPQDRRLVICDLSPIGHEVMNQMWVSGRQQMEKLLHGLSLEDLQKADALAEILLRNVKANTDIG
jgi:DNA-binding MarR family transcriptional regulator